MNQVIDVMCQHRSIRKFKEEPVHEDIVKTILKAAQHVSTSNFVQAWTIIRVNDADKRTTISQLAGPQEWVASCPLFLVFCADLKRSEQACVMCDTEMVTGYTEQFIIATVDAALVAQNTMLAAESFGLGGVYIGGIRNDPQKVSELLEIPDLVYPVFGMCLGYPDEYPQQKPRLPLDVVVSVDRYSNAADRKLLAEYDNICSEYYNQRSCDSREDNWTKQISRLMSQEMRPHMRSFLESKGFRMK
jgi:nitroreductase